MRARLVESAERLDIAKARSAMTLGARAAALTGAYLAAGAAVLLIVLLVRGAVAPATLRGMLAFILVATLAAGLEPGTVKAAALGEGGLGAGNLGSWLAVGAFKGVLASPILALVWRFADPSADVAALAWTPAVAAAGFCATELRSLLDLKGRHVLATAFKQGSLAGGVAVLGTLVALRLPLSWAIGASTLARLALLGLAPRLAPGERWGAVWRPARRLLTDRRWLELAAVSAIAAASGSTDRIFGLRYLGAADYSAYYVTYEILSKFWLLPYLLSPILFARRAAGETGFAFARGAVALTAAAGAAFLAALAGLLTLAPGLVAKVVGASFGPATLGFAAAVVLGAFGQLRLAWVQGSGRSRQAALAMGLSAGVSVPLFLGAASMFGARGLLLAWLAKSAVELAALSIGPR